MRLPVVALALVVACLAAGEAEFRPLLRASLSNLARSRERFVESLYGQVLMAEDLADLRASLQRAAAGLGEGGGLDPLALLTEAAGIDLALVGLERYTPQLLMEVRGKAVVGPLAALLGRHVEESKIGHPCEGLAWARAEDAVVLGFAVTKLRRLPTEAPAEADLVLRWDVEMIGRALGGLAPEGHAEMADLLVDLLPEGRATVRLTPRGLRQELRLGRRPAGLVPIDPRILAELPRETDALLLLGLDGRAWWEAHSQVLLAALAGRMTAGGAVADAAAALAQLDGMLALIGCPDGAAAFCAGISGTLVVAVELGGLLPGIAVGIPRSPAMDRLVGAALTLGHCTSPEEGGIAFLALSAQGRRLALAGLCLGRGAKHWWLCTDSLYLHRLLEGKGAWAETRLGRQLGEAIGEEKISVAMVRHGRELLRLLPPLAGLAGARLEQGKEVERCELAGHRLALAAGPEFMLGRDADGGFVITGEGPLGITTLLAPAALPAALALPASLAHALVPATPAPRRPDPPERLKRIYGAETQFATGAHNDRDQDHRGEYGFLGQLSGATACFGTNGQDGSAAGTLKLLDPEFTDDDAPIDRYRYRLYLPDGQGGAEEYRATLAKIQANDNTGVNDHERFFVCYAWPADAKAGGPVYAITQEGQVLSAPAEGLTLPPAWNLAFGGATGPAREVFRQPTWSPFQTR